MLILNVSYVMNVCAAQQIYVFGNAWDHTTIKVYIRSRPDLTGWKDSYVQDIQTAVSNWKTSIASFTSQYGYTYLNQFSFPTYEVDTFPELKEIRIDFVWNDPTFSGTTTVYTWTGTQKISRADTLLDLEDATWVSMMRLASHELGHALNLGHADTEGDLMFSSTDPAKWGSVPSTLDIYGLAVGYEWLKTGTFTPPVEGWYSLPPAIPYKTLIGGVGGIVISIDKFGLLAPYIGFASTILVATVAAAICVKRVKHRKERKEE